ncbi:uncharacterized protein LOC129588382 [Paramacrobiotus metropolitanus]|uniref:uncharacterized protein LOC129588382 n=1 Tax=Paramacrobiotus metropolitanus TaxID=2943436 RepID=UPI0024458E45|nr:uncharacterized protein LOC129588382 [Paramacrobiotus metropolitanus]
MSIVTLQPLVLTTGQLHNRIAVLTFGALQVSFGALLVVLDVGAFIRLAPPSNAGYGWCHNVMRSTGIASGFWGGGLFIFTGIFGLLAGRSIPPQQGPRSRRAFLITALIFSIFGLIASMAVSPISSLFADNLSYCAYYASQKEENTDTTPFAGLIIAALHATIFSIMIVVNLGQLVSTSVNINKLPKDAPPVTYIMTTMPNVPDQRMILTAVNTHPTTMPLPLAPVDSVPPPYSLQQQISFVQHAVDTHPK